MPPDDLADCILQTRNVWFIGESDRGGDVKGGIAVLEAIDEPEPFLLN
jgi:hypothetical protein